MKNKLSSVLSVRHLLALVVMTALVVVGSLSRSVNVEPSLASNEDGTIDPNALDNQYAWSENIGWINFQVSDLASEIHITDAGFTGYAWSESHGWINMNPAGSGVLVAADGALSGSAWGENTGYIDFSGVSIDESGLFAGTATGTITGTISFDCSNCTVETDYIPDDFLGGARRTRATTGDQSAPESEVSATPAETPVSADEGISPPSEEDSNLKGAAPEEVEDIPELDMDEDGLSDALDPDMDGDGIANIFDGDTDGDGIGNIQDSDDDADGIADGDDDSPTGLGTEEDIDGDGLLNDVDPDMDGDGFINVLDEDTDGDGSPNEDDHDDDQDGLPDDFDISPRGLGDEDDLDGDGIINALDSDRDGDGIPNRDDSRPDGDGPSEDLSLMRRSADTCSDILVDIDGDSEEEAIRSLVDDGFFLCPPEGNFNPNGKVTRADLIKLVAIGLGASREHAADGEWYADWWQFLIEKEVLRDDISPIRYEPRADFLAVVAKATGVDITDLPACSNPSFADVSLEDWYCSLVEYALDEGWITDEQILFGADTLSSRSWAAGVIYRAFVR